MKDDDMWKLKNKLWVLPCEGGEFITLEAHQQDSYTLGISPVFTDSIGNKKPLAQAGLSLESAKQFCEEWRDENLPKGWKQTSRAGIWYKDFKDGKVYLTPANLSYYAMPTYSVDGKPSLNLNPCAVRCTITAKRIAEQFMKLTDAGWTLNKNFVWWKDVNGGVISITPNGCNWLFAIKMRVGTAKTPADNLPSDNYKLEEAIKIADKIALDWDKKYPVVDGWQEYPSNCIGGKTFLKSCEQGYLTVQKLDKLFIGIFRKKRHSHGAVVISTTKSYKDAKAMFDKWYEEHSATLEAMDYVELAKDISIQEMYNKQSKWWSGKLTAEQISHTLKIEAGLRDGSITMGDVLFRQAELKEKFGSEYQLEYAKVCYLGIQDGSCNGIPDMARHIAQYFANNNLAGLRDWAHNKHIEGFTAHWGNGKILFSVLEKLFIEACPKSYSRDRLANAMKEVGFNRQYTTFFGTQVAFYDIAGLTQ